MTPGLADALHLFGVHSPVQVAETKIATVWRVRHEGADRALKLYKDANTHDEWPGVRLIASRKGAGVVKLHATGKAALLMEWLDGPTLGDLSRAGQDDKATTVLAEVAQSIHAATQPIDLPDLRARFSALSTAPLNAQWLQPHRHSLRASQCIAQRLLDQQTHLRPLHGDLHHDNIRKGQRGFVAFDAKGLFGDPAYDFANAFMNPMDAPRITNDAARIQRTTAIFAAKTGIARKHLLDWAAAHCALSIMWSAVATPQAHFELLDLLHAAAHQG